MVPTPFPATTAQTSPPTAHLLGNDNIICITVRELFVYCCSVDISNLFDILDELCHVSSKWKGVGLALRLHPDTLDTIEADHHDVASRHRAVLTMWLRKSYDTTAHGEPCWDLLVAAVAHPFGGNDRALADKIAKKHNGKCMSHTCTCMYIQCMYIPIADISYTNV